MDLPRPIFNTQEDESWRTMAATRKRAKAALLQASPRAMRPGQPSSSAGSHQHMPPATNHLPPRVRVPLAARGDGALAADGTTRLPQLCVGCGRSCRCAPLLLLAFDHRRAPAGALFWAGARTQHLDPACAPFACRVVLGVPSKPPLRAAARRARATASWRADAGAPGACIAPTARLLARQHRARIWQRRWPAQPSPWLAW